MFPEPSRISLFWSCFILVVSLSKDAAGLRWAEAQNPLPCLADTLCVSVLPKEMELYLCLGCSRAVGAGARQDT